MADPNLVEALLREVQTWTEEEQAEVRAAAGDESEHGARLFIETIDAIRRRRAAQAPLPQDPLALAIRKAIPPAEMVAMARTLLSEAKTEEDRREIRAMLDELRRQGFPMGDA